MAKPSIEKVIEELQRECRKSHGWDGCKTQEVRIWLIRRATEYLMDFHREKDL